MSSTLPRVAKATCSGFRNPTQGAQAPCPISTEHKTARKGGLCLLWRWGIGHGSLSILFRSSKNTKCPRPRRSCRKATSVRLSKPHASKAVCLLHLHKQNDRLCRRCFVIVEMGGFEPPSNRGLDVHLLSIGHFHALRQFERDG